ncbi:MAG TPA: GIY-YIG nuclease family protein [Verrucomicrobiae bacterium]|nr:GIY-YIG nuclease family protein [Verrucomicrobiae bacterium]
MVPSIAPLLGAAEGRLPTNVFEPPMTSRSFLIPMFYAYILESINKPGEYYRGHTDDLKRRVAEHNAGKCIHTSNFMPWKVKFYAALETLESAKNFERYLKSGSGHAFAKRHFLNAGK